MAKANRKLDAMTVPDGGIGDFIMEDAEIEEAYGPDDDGMEEYGDEGIAQFPALTKKMAAMGRGGDDVVAHLQTGEIVIPLALIEQDEALKEGIFQRLRDMGVEDPERYVVGSEANSINPNTGAAEFFLKNLSKSIAKSVKSVVPVLKQIAPIALPILGSMAFGPIFGAALGSGIASLINGGSMKDALKSALISGATGAVMAGVSGAVSGVGFVEGVSAAANPANISSGFKAVGTAFTDGLDASGIGFGAMKYGIAGGEQVNAILAEQAAAAAAAGAGANAGAVSSAAPQQTSAVEAIRASDTAIPSLNNTGTSVEPLVGGARQTIPPAGTSVEPLVGGARQTIPPAGTSVEPLAGGQVPAGASVKPTVSAYEPPGFMESILEGNISEAFFPTGPTDAQVQMARTAAYTDAYNAVAALPGTTSAQAAQAGLNAMNATTASSIGPGLLRTYGPMAAVGTGVAAASGAFSSPEQGEPGIVDTITGEDLVAADPSKYLVSDFGSQVLDPNTGTYVPQSVNPMAPISDLTIQVPTPYLQGSTPGGPFARPYVTQAAQGGAIFPRRNGGIMPDEGIPGQDSVRAMLMPGEFVMTTDAVRGAGNGNLNNGIKNMYSVMRDLEARGRA